jgi:DNA modification methylase
MKLTSLVIEYIPISRLTSDPGNPRLHSEKQVSQLARSIRTFGLNAPLLVDGELRLVCGHGRLAACRQLGITEIPIVRLQHLSPDQVRAFRIADNRLCEIAEWNERLLGEQLKLLSEVELDFDLDVIGFEVGEIDLFIENLSTVVEEDFKETGSFAGENTTPVSQVGDVWKLGNHRVLCANALLKASYECLLQGQFAHVVFADPPYNVPIAGHVSGNGKHQHREFVMGSGELSDQEFKQFLANTLQLLAAHSHPQSLLYVCMDWRHIEELLMAGRAANLRLKNLCVWSKDAPGLGSFYRSQHELVLVFQNGDGTSQNNIALGRYGRSRSNVWRYPSMNSFGRKTDEGDLLALHPTVKPVALVADAILDCSSRRDIVLDPFLGSGTTLIAAERTGRICCGMEFDALYVDTAVCRWQRLTGLTAMHEATGKTFQECAEMRTHAA